MILKYFDIYIKERSKEITEKSIGSIEQTVYWMKRYEKAYKALTFSEINPVFYNSFRQFLQENDISDSTFGKHIKNIKAFMTWAGKHGLHKNIHYKAMRVIKKQADDQALNSAELRQLTGAMFSMKTVIEMIEEKDRIRLTGQAAAIRFKSFLVHRDIFVAMCSSGMYINDILNFTRDNIIESSYVKYVRHKKSGEVDSVCLFDYEKDNLFRFQELAEKYDCNFRLKLRSIYTDVKVMMQYLGIHKSITTKSGRKTWASIWYYEREAPISIIMRGLGHTKEESTRHYLRADDNDIVAQFRKRKHIGDRKPMVRAKGSNKIRVRKAG